MKNIDVIKAFIEGKQAKSHTGNLYTVGEKLINYNTVLAQRVGHEVIVNTTKYSTTTSGIQNSIKRELQLAGISYIETKDTVKIDTQDLVSLQF